MSISGIGKSLESTLFGSKKRVINTILTTVILFAVPITLQLTFQRQDVRQRASQIGADPACPNEPDVNGVKYKNSCSPYPCESGYAKAADGTPTLYYYVGTGANEACDTYTPGTHCCSTYNPNAGSSVPDLYVWIVDRGAATYAPGDTANVKVFVKNKDGTAVAGTITGKLLANTASGTNQISQCLAVNSCSGYGDIIQLSSANGISAGGYATLTGSFTVKAAPGGAWMVYAYINIPASGGITESDAAGDGPSANGGNNMSGASYGVTATTSSRCDAGPYNCTGQCTAPPNTCNTNNGTQGNCLYTTKIGGGSCSPYQAPDQTCTKNTCSSPQTCGGGGTPGVCGTSGEVGTPACTTQTYGQCTPNSPNACSSNSGTQSCSTTGTGCTPGSCGSRPCTPTCTTGTCGGGGTPGVCGTSLAGGAGGGICTPKTCQQLGVTCGSTSNGCGGTLNCGVCPPTSLPNCNATSSCSGTCNAPSDTCGTGNGTKTCTYTTYTGGGNCTQVAAPSQSCTVNNCQSPKTCSNETCSTPVTPIAAVTTTPSTGTANIAISVSLPGIGTESYNNDAPRAARTVSVTLNQSGTKQKVKEATSTVTYQNGKYTGNVSIPNITPGSYYVRVRLDNTQYKKNADSTIIVGANAINFSGDLVSGDLFNTNSIGLQEYNALVNCYNGGECLTDTRTKADLNDDGSVDAKDINIVLVEFARGQINGD